MALEWFEIDEASIPEEGMIHKVKVRGKMLCLVHYEHRYYAMSARCPHAGADLSKGWCEHHRLVCPYHRHVFDLESGKGAKGQGNYISSYSVEWRNGRLYVGLPISWLRSFFGRH